MQHAPASRKNQKNHISRIHRYHGSPKLNWLWKYQRPRNTRINMIFFFLIRVNYLIKISRLIWLSQICKLTTAGDYASNSICSCANKQQHSFFFVPFCFCVRTADSICVCRFGFCLFFCSKYDLIHAVVASAFLESCTSNNCNWIFDWKRNGRRRFNNTRNVTSKIDPVSLRIFRSLFVFFFCSIVVVIFSIFFYLFHFHFRWLFQLHVESPFA